MRKNKSEIDCVLIAVPIGLCMGRFVECTQLCDDAATCWFCWMDTTSLLYVVVVVDPCRCWGTLQLDGPLVVGG